MRNLHLSPVIVASCVVWLFAGGWYPSPGLNGMSAAVQAGDWPQILGPHRTGAATDEQLLPQWPAGGPQQLWQVPVGSGFAGVAVQQQRVVVFSREDDQEVVRLHAAETGRPLWTAVSPCAYVGGVSSDKGPRCVPLMHQGRVYVFGVEGRLRCLQLADGKEVWSRDTTADFDPLEGYFGVGSTPVVAGNLLLANVGGRDGSSVVAFDLETGRTVWQTFDDSASYSSPIVVQVGGVSQAIVVTRLHVLGLDPATGRQLFQMPFGMRGPTVNGATPVLLGDRLFLSSSYRIGSLLIQLEGGTARELWRDPELLATQYATPVQVGGHLYAVDGRQDAGPGSAVLKCLDVTGRKVLWQQEGFDYGTLLAAGQQLLFLTCGGELIQLAADPARYVEVQRATVLNPTESGYRLPALSRGQLYVRDDAVLKCLQVGSAAVR